MQIKLIWEAVDAHKYHELNYFEESEASRTLGYLTLPFFSAKNLVRSTHDEVLKTGRFSIMCRCVKTREIPAANQSKTKHHVDRWKPGANSC